MFEKVNPAHPDKVADRIAGAIVDLAYKKSENPKIAVEVLIGHGECCIQIETSEQLTAEELEPIVHRIAGEGIALRALITPQDPHLAQNQHGAIRCGDNGIFRGAPVTHEQQLLTDIAGEIYKQWPTDGKYIIGRYRHKGKIVPSEDGDRSLALTICQSGVNGGLDGEFLDWWQAYGNRHCWDIQEKYSFCFGRTKDDKKRYISLLKVNPLGEWTGGPNTDSGATNRKLGSDMGDGVTGGGLHGKDLSKADVSVNIWAHLEAQRTGKPVTACCSIGDTEVCGIPYEDIVASARDYIQSLGGFEKFAEWGLIRPDTD